MKIKVMGKARREGKRRKSGNDYSFNQVYFTSPNRGVERTAALTPSSAPSIIPYVKIRVGGEYEGDFGPCGYVVGFTPAKI